MQRVIRVSLFLVFLLVLSGCLGKELPKIQHYELNLDSNFGKDANQITKKPYAIFYLGTEASLKIAGKKIAYKTNENTIEYFARNEWIEPLPLMVDSIVIKAAKQMGFSIIAEKRNGTPTLSLNLLDFYYDQSREVAVLNLLIKQDNTSFLLTKETKVQSGDFYQIIVAMNQTINSALLELLSLLN